MASKNVSIVLCRPEGSANIGSVCRAMKTMGLERLKIVNPPPIDLDEIKKWSVHAFDLFEKAQFYNSLKTAVASSVLVAGTSRREGKKRKQFSLLPAEFATLAGQYSEGNLDLVFGNEKNGLNEEELNCCNHLVSIPSNGSLNLSHAVQILCYEIFMTESHPLGFQPIAIEKVETLAQHCVDQLEAIEFFKIAGDYGYNESLNFWYNVLGRAALNPSEEKFIRNLFIKIRHIKLAQT